MEYGGQNWCFFTGAGAIKAGADVLCPEIVVKARVWQVELVFDGFFLGGLPVHSICFRKQ